MECLSNGLRIAGYKLRVAATSFLYSDLGFNNCGEAVNKINGKR